MFKNIPNDLNDILNAYGVDKFISMPMEESIEYKVTDDAGIEHKFTGIYYVSLQLINFSSPATRSESIHRNNTPIDKNNCYLLPKLSINNYFNPTKIDDNSIDPDIKYYIDTKHGNVKTFTHNKYFNDSYLLLYKMVPVQDNAPKVVKKFCPKYPDGTIFIQSVESPNYQSRHHVMILPRSKYNIR